MNGKDTHVRGFRIFGPLEWVLFSFALAGLGDLYDAATRRLEMMTHSLSSLSYSRFTKISVDVPLVI